MTVRPTITRLGGVLMLLATPVQAGPTPAGDYHWARKQSQFTLQVGDNVNGVWSGMLRKAVSDWNTSGTVMFRLVSGGTNPQDCRPTTGRVEVCAWPYGTQEGWLGLTRLYFDDRGEHIESATVQVNDAFFDQSDGQYNSDTARRHTMCHELGHTPGLEHVNTNSCMNDSYQAVFHNLTPITKDFRQLSRIYGHKDSYTTVAGSQKDKHKHKKKHRQGGSEHIATRGFFAPTALPATPSGLAGTQTEVVQTLVGGRMVVSFITWAKE